MKMKVLGAAVALTVMTLSGCISIPPATTQGGPDLRLTPERVANARIRNINVTTARLYNVDLGGSFGEDIRAGLKACTRGGVDFDLRAHVEQQGTEGLTTTFELVDPGNGDAVVGRYRVATAYAAPLVLDESAAGGPGVGSRLGRGLCEQMTD